MTSRSQSKERIASADTNLYCWSLWGPWGGGANIGPPAPPLRGPTPGSTRRERVSRPRRPLWQSTARAASSVMYAPLSMATLHLIPSHRPRVL